MKLLTPLTVVTTVLLYPTSATADEVESADQQAASNDVVDLSPSLQPWHYPPVGVPDKEQGLPALTPILAHAIHVNPDLCDWDQLPSVA